MSGKFLTSSVRSGRIVTAVGFGTHSNSLAAWPITTTLWNRTLADLGKTLLAHCGRALGLVFRKRRVEVVLAVAKVSRRSSDRREGQRIEWCSQRARWVLLFAGHASELAEINIQMASARKGGRITSHARRSAWSGLRRAYQRRAPVFRFAVHSQSGRLHP